MIKAERHTVLLAGICSLVLCMGLGRYAFTPMIPVMQGQELITESSAGLLAGWGYMGYLVGLFVVWLVSDLKAKDFFYRYGLVVSVIATAVMAMNEHILVWGVSRFFAGISAAAGFMFGAGLIVNWLHQNGHSIRLGVYFCGMGLGIVFSALAVEFLHEMLGLHWRLQWLVLAALGMVLLVPAMGLLPLPKPETHEPLNTSRGVLAELPSARWLWLMQGAYFCAGFSNTMNVTFTSLMAEMQPLPGFGAKMWLVVGLAATPAPLIWEAIARRISYLDALMLAFATNIIGNLVLVNTASLEGTIGAAVLFGFSFMGIVSLTLTTVGRRFRGQSSQIMGRLTLGYCIAQVLSPIASGALAESRGSFTLPILGVVALMLLGLFFLTAVRREDVYRHDKPLFARAGEE